MSEKTQLEVLCMDKIPRLLRGEPASDVFKEPAKEIRACNAFCPEYYSIKGFTNTNLCEQDLQTVFLPDCRLGYPPIAQRSPKCTDEDLGKLFQDGLTSEERARYFDVPNFLPDNEYPGDFPVKF